MRKNKGLIIVLTIAIMVSVIINTICVFIACCPELTNKLFGINIPTHLSASDRVETSIISTGLSILGIAVAVWTGLNISNIIDKKRIDEIEEKINAENEKISQLFNNTKKELEEQTVQLNEQINTIGLIRKSQISESKAKLLQEMYATINDTATNELINKINEIPNETDVEFSELLEVEHDFRSVYELHQHQSADNRNLKMAAEHGISTAQNILKNAKDENVKLYLNFRIAEFYFYQGYCYTGEKRLKIFLEAIKRYRECSDGFNATVPDYKEFELKEENISIDFSMIRDDAADISAYFCNTIGEAYSKIKENEDELTREGHSKEKLKLYGEKAIYYCALANRWKNSGLYKRNLGCAIERLDGFEHHMKLLSNLYNEALNLAPNNIYNFKVLLSLLDKYADKTLCIEYILPESKRAPALNSENFAQQWIDLSEDNRNEIKCYLEKINDLSIQAKAIHPSKEVGYYYSCIYYRDMCAIYGNHTLDTDESEINKKKKIASTYCNKFEENLKILEVISPNKTMSKILRNDLTDLQKLL